MNILIIDDQPNLTRVTAMALRVLGCKTFTASSSRDAFVLLDSEKIDAIFLDANLGEEDGLEILSTMVAQDLPAPIVVFTAQTKDEIADEAISRGALACLSKPFTLDDLRQQIIEIELHLRGHGNRAKGLGRR
jgi:DNA-binding NtrC family response regulator